MIVLSGKCERIAFFCLLLLLVLLLSAGCNRQRQEEKNPPPKKEGFEGTIIAVGNSLTAGHGLEEKQAYPAVLQKKLLDHGLRFKVINAGISGETSSGALSRINWILSAKPDIVILETGANDGLRGIPVQVIEDNIRQAVRILQKNGVIVVLAGMQMVRNLGPDYTKAFADLYRKVAREEKVIFIPFFLQGVAGEPSLNQQDTIHPTEQGYRLVVDTIYPYVVQAIEHLKGNRKSGKTNRMHAEPQNTKQQK